MPFRLSFLFMLFTTGFCVEASSLQCGQTFTHRHVIDKRIVGGVTSGTGVWPWQVALLLDNRQVCAGSIISSKWIISAGHCFMDPRSSTDPKRWSVLLGERSKATRVKSHFEKRRKVKRVIVHPDFKGVIVNMEYSKPIDYDIALLELEEPVQFDNSIYPICLPSDSVTTLVPGKMCYITGWGRKGWKGARANTLRQAVIPLISRAECNKVDSYNGEVHETSICAGYEDGQVDACQSDSGGPLSCQERGRWFLAGVISWGKRCGQPHKFGVYANVKRLKAWIADVISYRK